MLIESKTNNLKVNVCYSDISLHCSRKKYNTARISNNIYKLYIILFPQMLKENVSITNEEAGIPTETDAS